MAKHQAIIYRIDKRVLDNIRNKLPENRRETVLKMAIGIAKIAESSAPSDRGNLKRSIVARMRDGYHSTGGGLRATRPRMNRGKRQITTRLPKPKNDQYAFVGPTVFYGAFIEYGTRRNRQKRPYLRAGVDWVQTRLSQFIGPMTTGNKPNG